MAADSQSIKGALNIIVIPNAAKFSYCVENVEVCGKLTTKLVEIATLGSGLNSQHEHVCVEVA